MLGRATGRCIILGTAHGLQENDPGLRKKIESVLNSSAVGLIAEEVNADKPPKTVALEIATTCHIPRLSIDMTTEEKKQAGILEDLNRRPDKKLVLTVIIRCLFTSVMRMAFAKSSGSMSSRRPSRTKRFLSCVGSCIVAS